MVLKEYVLRGMAERTLVLAPASLVGQWREELETKFGLAFATTYDALLRDDPSAFWAQKRIVASIATARRREHAERLSECQFDLVIVDEAHHLRDRSSQSWKLVDSLNKRFLLLLSATPVQNDLIELYNLLTLLKPGIFKTQAEFRAAYMLPGKPRQPANVDNLRQLVRSAMIRNTRAVAALKLPRRTAVTIKAEPAADEAEAYAGVADAARALVAGCGTGGVGRQRLMLHHLLGAAGSSPAAASGAAARIADKLDGDKTWRALADRFAAIPCGGKEAALLNLLRRNADEKKLVFVQSRETLKHLAARLEAEGIGHARFDGSMSGPDKDAAIAVFREQSSVLLCTQTGGEGRNIQFCNTLINFDVPWNPMAIEQRIGRIDRIGQTREVFVFNLVVRGTVEEKVLGLLEEKISMFELVVGEIGAIIGSVEEEREFPDLVLDAWLEASEAGRTAAFDALGDKLDVARRRHDEAKELDERLFGQDLETG
jgi:SNF2 family DNA or RNA helicase